MNFQLLASILFQEIKKPIFFASVVIFAFLALLFALIVLNFTSYAAFITANYSLLSKLNILYLITIGSFSAISKIDSFFLVLTCLLVGLNASLTIEKIKILRKSKSLELTFGAGLISLAATGCASCGLSLASIVGLTGVLVVLPFGGIELYLFSILILLGILFHNLNSYSKACKIR